MFVYRTIDDLNAIEAAGALKALGLNTHVIEFAAVLMAEQLDQMGGEMLRRKITAMGVTIYTGKDTRLIARHGGKTKSN